MSTTLVCSFELNKTDGVTLTVTNESDKITQTVTLNGKTLTVTVKKGDDKKTTITQDAESLVFEVKGEETSSQPESGRRFQGPADLRRLQVGLGDVPEREPEGVVLGVHEGELLGERLATRERRGQVVDRLALMYEDVLMPHA